MKIKQSKAFESLVDNIIEWGLDMGRKEIKKIAYAMNTEGDEDFYWLIKQINKVDNDITLYFCIDNEHGDGAIYLFTGDYEEIRTKLKNIEQELSKKFCHECMELAEECCCEPEEEEEGDLDEEEENECCAECPCKFKFCPHCGKELPNYIER